MPAKDFNVWHIMDRSGSRLKKVNLVVMCSQQREGTEATENKKADIELGWTGRASKGRI